MNFSAQNRQALRHILEGRDGGGVVIETVSAIRITMFKTGGLIKVRGKGKAVVVTYR